jgi:hypothetical protein
MTRPSSVSAPEDLFAAIATLLEPGQREYFYQRMLYFRQLRPEDELLRLVEAIGLLALLIREAPHAVAREREQLAQLLETSLATVHAAAEAAQAYHQQLDDRLTRLPADLAQGISPERIAGAITESVRQQFVHSGVPATAEALKAVSQHLTHATGQFQRAASQLSDCTGIAERAQGAIDRMTTSVANATDTARRAIETVRQEFHIECVRAVCLLCGAAWVFGVFGGVVFERWRGVGIQVVPPAIAVPAAVAEPSSSRERTPKKPTPAPLRDRPRAPHKPTPHDHDAEPRHGTDVERGSNRRGTAAGSEDTKPKA